MTKTKAWKGAGLGITFTLLGAQENVKEWAHTFPSGFPLWELESQWTFEFSKSNLKRSKLIGLRIYLYH
jgi:hypothetical protein